MKRVITNIYTVFVILALIGLAGWFYLSLTNSRAINLDVFEKESSGFTEKMENLLKSGDAMQSREFSALINSFFNDEKKLNALVIYSHDKGVLYQKAVSQNESLLTLMNQAPSLQVPLEYELNEIFFRKYTTGLNLDGSAGTDVDYIYELTGRDDIYSYLRFCLIGVISLFLLTIIMILLVPRLRDRNSNDNPTGDSSVEDFENELMATAEIQADEDNFGKPESSFPKEDDFSSGELFSDSANSSFDNDMDDDFDSDSFGEADIPSTEDLQAMDHEYTDESSDAFSFDDDLDDLPEPDADGSFEMPSDDDDDFELPEENNLSSDNFSLDDDDFDFDSEEDDFSFDSAQEASLDAPESSFETKEASLDAPESSFETKEASFDTVETPAPLDSPEENISFDEEDDMLSESRSDLLMDNDFDQEADENEEIIDNPLNPLENLEEKLGLELEKAASFNQDLVLISMRDESIKSSEEYNNMADQLIGQFISKDMIFGDGKDSFALIQQNTDLDKGISRMEQLARNWKQKQAESRLQTGLSSRNGRLISENRLLKESGSALKKADDDKSIIAFRSDPDKFREFISQES